MTRKPKHYAFSKKAIVSESPIWAKWLFRGSLIVTSAATFIIASDPTINDALKVQFGVYINAANLLIYGFSKMFGVEPAEKE